MDWFEILKTIHILAAAVWVGTAISSQVLGSEGGDGHRRRRQGQDDQLRRGSGALGQAGVRAASGLALISGIFMVLDHPGIDFQDTWIIIGIAIFVISSAIGVAYFTPETPKLLAGLREGKEQDPDFRARVARITLISRIDLVLLIAVVVNMVVKPGV